MIGFPKVSMLVPVYKVERLIERCAVSLFEQTYDNIEYIFVDDCTPDNSIGVLRQVMERYPDRAEQTRILRHEHNLGQAAARNTMIEAAMGDYVMFVDSDDWIDRTTVEKCVKKIMEKDADIVKFGIKILRKHYTQHFEALPTYNQRDLFLAAVSRKSPTTNVCGGLLKRTLFTDNKIRCEEGLDMGEDWFLMVQLTYHAKQVTYLNETLYFYDCTNELQSTHTFNEKNIAKSDKIRYVLEKYVADKGADVVAAFSHEMARYKIGKLKTYALACGDYCMEYKKSYAECKNIEKIYMNQIPIRHKFLVHIPSYSLAKLYVKFMVLCGNVFRGSK